MTNNNNNVFTWKERYWTASLPHLAKISVSLKRKIIQDKFHGQLEITALNSI